MKKIVLLISITCVVILTVPFVFRLSSKTVTVIDYNFKNNIEDMSTESEIIVTGEFTEFDSSWNMRRDPANIQQEADDHYVEGKKYLFRIHDVLKGNINSEIITVNIRYGDDYNGSLTVDPLFCEPVTGSEYLLFAGYFSEFDIYSLSFYPGLIRNDNGVASSDEDFRSVIKDYEDFISGRDFSDLVQEIKTIVNGKE